MSGQTIIVRLAVAAILGALVGLERHWADKSAGMRTHMLVSIGSALIIIVSEHAFDDVISPARIVLDPSRVAAQVVSGVGFLGAGLILRRNSNVFGLTTAAGIWASSGIGLAAGGGLYFAACAATALILITLTAIKSLEERIAAKHEHHTLVLIVNKETFSLRDFEAMIKDEGLTVAALASRRAQRPDERRITINLKRSPKAKMLMLIDRLHSDTAVKEVGFRERRT
jgi:putative Mg2+ transporter-C (MgtC) family protein